MRLDSKWATDDSDDSNSKDQTVEYPDKKSHTRTIRSSLENSSVKSPFKSPKKRSNTAKLVSKWDNEEKTPKEINFRSVNQQKEQAFKNFETSNRAHSSREFNSNRANRRNPEIVEKSSKNSLFDRIPANKHSNQGQYDQPGSHTGSATAYETVSDSDEACDSEEKPLEDLSYAAKSFAQRLGIKVDENHVSDNVNKYSDSNRNHSTSRNGLSKPFQHDKKNLSRKSPRNSQKNNKIHRDDHSETYKNTESDSKVDKKTYEALLEQVNSLKFQNEQLEKIISDSKISLIPEPSSGCWADWGDEE